MITHCITAHPSVDFKPDLERAVDLGIFWFELVETPMYPGSLLIYINKEETVFYFKMKYGQHIVSIEEIGEK